MPRLSLKLKFPIFKLLFKPLEDFCFAIQLRTTTRTFQITTNKSLQKANNELVLLKRLNITDMG